MGYLGNAPADQAIQIGADTILSSHIDDGVIVNADINASAAIATSKISGALTSVGSHGLATSATTDTTSASNISSGTLAAARVATLNQNTTGTAATVTGAAQTNITSVGTLSSLTVTGNVTLNTGDSETSLTFEDAGTNAMHIKVGSGDEIYFGSNNSWQTRYKTDGNVQTQGNWVYTGNITGLQGWFSKDDTTPVGTPDGETDDLVVGSTDTAQTGIQFFGSGGNHIYFGDAGSSTIGRIDYLHSDNSMKLFTNSALALTIDSTQHATFAGSVKGDRHTLMDGNTTCGHLIREETITGGGSSQDVCLFAETGLELHFMTGGSVTKVLTLDTSNNATFAGAVNVGTATNNGKIHIRYDESSGREPMINFDSAANNGEDHFMSMGSPGTSNTLNIGWRNNTNGFCIARNSNDDLQSGEQFQIGPTGNTTFAGKVEVGSTTGMARLQVDNDADNPPYQFVNDSNSGFFRAADGQPGIAGYGVEIARFIPANTNGTYAEMALRSLHDDGQGCKIRAYTTTDSSDFAEILFTRNGSSETGMQFIVHDQGNSSKTTHFYYNGDVYNPSNSTAWQTSSDIRIKKDINDLTGAVDILKQIRPVSYKFKKAWTDQKGLEYDNVRNGFIANEYKDVFPNAVKADTNPFKVGSETYDDFLSLDTEDLVPYLVKAVQEMSAKIEALENA